MRQEKRRNNKRGFAEWLFYSTSLKFHLLFQTFTLLQLFLLRCTITHHLGHVLHLYLPSVWAQNLISMRFAAVVAELALFSPRPVCPISASDPCISKLIIERPVICCLCSHLIMCCRLQRLWLAGRFSANGIWLKVRFRGPLGERLNNSK